MSQDKIQEIEMKIYELHQELNELRKAETGTPVPEYTFATQNGDVTLSELFGNRDQLLAIHNMGQTCIYCTIWADGLNGLLPHLEDAMAVVLVSRDAPHVQREFANARGWRYRLASHGGGSYIQEQSVSKGQDNYPGAVLYQKDGDRILRRSSTIFGPGDSYCALWPLLGMAGQSEEDWSPKFSYWQDS